MDKITIKISKDVDDNFIYSIFDTDEVEEDTEELAGGICTSEDLKIAIAQASGYTIDLVESIKK